MMQGEHQIVREHRYVAIWIDFLVFILHGAEIVDRHVVHGVEEEPDKVQHAVVDVQADTAFALEIQEHLRVETCQPTDEVCPSVNRIQLD